MAEEKQLEQEQQEGMFISLVMKDDREIKCEVITIFELMSQNYIVLSPVEGKPGPRDLFFYCYSEDGEGGYTLDNIRTEEEFNMVGKTFDDIMKRQKTEELLMEILKDGDLPMPM